MCMICTIDVYDMHHRYSIICTIDVYDMHHRCVWYAPYMICTIDVYDMHHRCVWYAPFKILLITYKALNGLAPQYLSELLSHYSPSRPLRSQNSGHLIIPRISKSTAGGRSFSYLAPKLWNNLPNTVREADTLCQFKSRLKTHLFNLAYT